MINISITDDLSDVQYQIVITMSECKYKIININKTFHLLEIIPERTKFMTKDNKGIEYYPSKVINANNKRVNDMINKEREYLFGSTVDQN
jgi:phage pi2 protein 07